MKLLIACLLAVTLVAQEPPKTTKVSDKAATALKVDEEKARLEEAKDLLREKANLELRIKEIEKRLAELDNGAKGRPVITYNTGSIICCANTILLGR